MNAPIAEQKRSIAARLKIVNSRFGRRMVQKESGVTTPLLVERA
jgi:hypothetical protein